MEMSRLKQYCALLVIRCVAYFGGIRRLAGESIWLTLQGAWAVVQLEVEA